MNDDRDMENLLVFVSDEQSEHFAFVVLDGTGTLFRFGYCRRSNREATCLCIIRYIFNRHHSHHYS